MRERGREGEREGKREGERERVKVDAPSMSYSAALVKRGRQNILD